MPFHGTDHVVTCAATVVWDGINNPDVDERTGKQVHTLKVAFPENAPEKQELEQLATKCLSESEFRGQMPPGGIWPVKSVNLEKTPELTGHVEINTKTWNGIPEVLDANNQPLASMSFRNSFYPGAKVKVLVHAYPYNNKNKGIGFGLDGIQIIDDTAPALSIAGGMSRDEVASAFGGGGGQTPPPAGPPAQQGGQGAAPPPNPAGPPPQQGGTPVQPNPGAVATPPGQGAAPPPPAGGPAGPPPAPSGPVMTDKAGGTPYEQWIAAGWTDDQLRQHGYMQ